MRKVIYYLCVMTFIVIVPMSCNDNNGAAPAKELLLSKIVRDEVTLMDFLYDENKLISMNLYDNNGELVLYTEYLYDNDEMVESRLYVDDNSMTAKIVFTHSKAGQISKGELYNSDSGFEDVERIITFSYYPSGQLKSRELAALGQPPYSSDEFTYDGAGHRVLLTRSSYPYDPDDEYVSYEIDYTPGDKLIPNHWNQYAFLLMTLDLEGYLLDMFNVSSHRTSWNSDGKVTVENRTDASNQQFNADGYLINQTLKRITLTGLSPQQLDKMTYEYVE